MATKPNKRRSESVPLVNVEPESPTSTYVLEKYVLGTLLSDPGSLNSVAEYLIPERFSSLAHATIFESILQMDEEHIPIDIVPLIEHLRNSQQLEAVGGIAYISSLIETTVYAEHLPAYCKMIHDKWILREMSRLAGNVQQDIQQPGIEAEDLLNDFTSRIFELSRGNAISGFRSLREILNPTHEKIAEYRNRRGAIVGISSGFHELDELTGGFQKSDLIILAARPSVGKTSLALNIALSASRDYGHTVGFISLEMAAEQIVLRLLAMQAKLGLHQVRTGHLDSEEYDRLRRATEPLYEIPFFIDDGSNQSLNEVRAKVRRLKKEKGLDIVFLDYLGLMRQPSDSESVQVAVSNITRGLKALAKEIQIPIVVLSQLSRAAVDMEKSDKRPKLHHLRDSGSIEQDADVVLMLYREFYDKAKAEEMSEEEKNAAEIIVAKQRNGPTGTVNVLFKREYASFVNTDRVHEESEPPQFMKRRSGTKPTATTPVTSGRPVENRDEEDERPF